MVLSYFFSSCRLLKMSILILLGFLFCLILAPSGMGGSAFHDSLICGFQNVGKKIFGSLSEICGSGAEK
jgi:hypothetical protein